MPQISLDAAFLPPGLGNSYYHALRVARDGAIKIEVLTPTGPDTEIAQMPPVTPGGASDPRFVVWDTSQLTFSIGPDGHLRMKRT